MLLTSFIGFAFLLFQPFAKEICTKLHMGTTLGPHAESSNIIKDGVPTPLWNPDLPGSAVISASKNLDFFYLPNVKFDLQDSNIRLWYDNTDHVVSHAILKKEQKGFYTIEMSYNCDTYGGVLVTLKLDIDVPNCGGTTISWRKLCGNPFTEREGLTVEMIFDNTRQAVVKNGRALIPQYYDHDIKNYAYLLPKSAKKVRLEAFLNYDDIKNDANSTNVHAFGSIQQNAQKKFSAATYISAVRVDSDKNVMDVRLQGELVHGSALVNTSRAGLEMTFECVKEGNSTIEMDIILPIYKDITLFFVKTCDVVPVGGHRTLGSFTFWLVLLLLLVFAFIIYRSYKQNGKIIVTATLFYNEISTLYQKILKAIKGKGQALLGEQELGGVNQSKSAFEDNDSEGLRARKNVDRTNIYGTL